MRISDWSSDVCSSDLLLCPIRFERLLNDNVIRRSVFTAHINHDRHRECGVEEDAASPPAHPCRRCDPHARASIGHGNSGGVLRSEERRVGKEWVSTCTSRGPPTPHKNQQ